VFSSVFRSDMLDQEIQARLAGGRKMRLPQLVDAMEEAATTDLRAEAVLPLALRVIGTPGDPQLAGAMAQLQAWVADGAHRRDQDGDGVYEHADAIRILDAWWPLWMTGQFQPALGPTLLRQLVANVGFDNAPNNHGAHLGSAYQNGWYGYAQKDLMAVLGQQVKFFNENYGGEAQAGIAVLDMGKKARATLKSQSGLHKLTRYFGQTVQFPMANTLAVEKNDIVALTVPTWAPALAVGLPDGTAWRASRQSECKAQETTQEQTAQTTVGQSKQYACKYQTARLTYSVTLITNPKASDKADQETPSGSGSSR
jgi:hypothetical protein